jgi:hypothetical protein
VIVPNKVLALGDTVLSKLPVILGEGPSSVDVVSVYRELAGEFESVDQFLLTLDVLYILGRIDLNPATRMLAYAR